MTATHVLLTCEQPSPLSLSLTLSLSLPLPRSLSPSSQWRAHAIFDESRGHVGFSLSRVSTTNFKRSRGNQWRKRELSQRIGEWKFLFLISAFRSNRSEITTRKIVKKKERRLSSFSSRENVRRLDVFHDRYPMSFIRVSEVSTRYFRLRPSSDDSQAKRWNKVRM